MVKCKSLLFLCLLLTLSSAFQITSISTDPTGAVANTQGSTYGGTNIYIKGSGFTSHSSEYKVFVGDYPCNIIEGIT